MSPVTSPQEIPATMSFIGTPAAISDIHEAQVEAIDVEPFDSKVSDTARIAYGNSSIEGRTGFKALSARAPCPISLRPGPLEGLVSPTEYEGKLYWWMYLFSVIFGSSPSTLWTSERGASVTISQI